MFKWIIGIISIVLIIVLGGLGYVAYTTIAAVPTTVEEFQILLSEKIDGHFEEMEIPIHLQSEFITNSTAKRVTITAEPIELIMLEFDTNANAKDAFDVAKKETVSFGPTTTFDISPIDLHFISHTNDGYRYVLLNRGSNLIFIKSKDKSLIGDLLKMFR
ncbi:MAG: hypothetical protein COA82_09900 [Alkaliphilus sp.]|nr:hypothetical protein [bacterium AH-315-L21]MBN4056554.1 hypothetical protein [bacterium AH-315-K05]MBN4074311.1 hypothetical protein [bacterium AH-315-E09]PHS31780.1 MAG: hypothetical protein COA82_09900 [Alkaliphilus sp.]